MKLKILFFLMIDFLILQGKIDSSSIKLGKLSDNKIPSSCNFNPENRKKQEGFKDIINYGDGFLAINSDGRIDWISEIGKILKSEKIPEEEFNNILTFNQKIVVAGNNGLILISSNNGELRKVNSGTNNNINSLALFKEKIIAGADQGEILIGDEKGMFKKIRLNLKGNIVSISARTSDCYGVTNEGEIIYTADGINWNIFDFNKAYAGFYKPCNFIKVLTTKNQIAVIGKQIDGLPVLIVSSRGKVWTERTLNYTDDQGIFSYLEDIPNDLFFDFSKDRYILVCNNGKVMTVPSCPHCNKLYKLTTENLTGISGNEFSFIVIGENDYLQMFDIEFF